MNLLQVIFTLGLIVTVSSLPIEFTQTHGDLKLTVNDIFSEINDVLKRELNEQFNKDPIDFGDKVNTTASDGGKLQVQVQHFNSANGFPVFFKPSDGQILDDKKVTQVVDKVDEHATETSTSVTFSTSLTKSSSAPKTDVSKLTESVSTTSAVPSTTKLTETVTSSSATTTNTNSASSLETVSTSSAAPIITIILPEKVSPDSITKAPISIRSIEQTVLTTTAIPSTTRLSSSAAGAISTTSVAPAITTTLPAKNSEVSTESVSTTTAAAPSTSTTAAPSTTTTTKAPETTTSGNIFIEAFESFASLFQSKPESPAPTTTHAPTTTTTVAATTTTGSVSGSTSIKQSDVAEVPSTSNSPIVQIVELKKDIAAVPVILTQV